MLRKADRTDGMTLSGIVAISEDAALNVTPGIACKVPDGAAHVFPSGAALPTPIATNADVCAYILAASGPGLATCPAFGLPEHFRPSYAYARADLEDGCARLNRAVQGLISNLRTAS